MKSIKSGFTFIELLIYIAVVALVMTSMMQLAWNAIGAGLKNSKLAEVHVNARYISERIKYEIRNANGINTGSSTFGSSPGVLSLSQTAPNDPTVIDLSGGNVRIKQGAGATVNLNASATQVTSLIFTNYTSADNLTKNVSFSLTIQSNYSGQRFEYKESVSLKGDAELRSN